eukprot:jgi/Botrbrau1/3892/Bobra.0183s0113.1
MHLKGGCLCGLVRYEVTGEPSEDATLCHCRMCQRSCGAPAVAWVTFPEEALEVVEGETKQYASSEKGVRDFCPTCGSQLFFRYTVPPPPGKPPSVDIVTTSLDDPDVLPPALHIFCSSARPWLRLADDLPARPEG